MKILMTLLLGLAVLGLVTGTAFAQAKMDKSEWSGPSFTARLTGDQNVPASTTGAKGEITFHANKAEDAIHYILDVKDLNDVTAAHLYVGAKGQTGQPCARLFPAPMTGEQKMSEGEKGRLAEGVLRASDLTGPLAGQTITELIAKMRTGDLYVAVATKTTPAGEIRGQVAERGGLFHRAKEAMPGKSNY